MTFTLEDRVKCDDPYYSVDICLDTAMEAMEEAKAKIREAKDAMHDADRVKHTPEIAIMEQQLEALVTLIDAYSADVEKSSADTLADILAECVSARREAME